MHKIGLREIFLSSGRIDLKALKLCDYILGTLIAKIIPAARETGQIMLNRSRILVIRPGGIGDAVFLLPVFKAIKLKHPHISIDVICQRRNAPVFISQGHLVSHVFVYESLIEWRDLYKNQYDIVVDTEQWHYLSALTARSIKTQLSIGFATRPLRSKFFNLAVKYDFDAYELDNFALLFAGLINDRKQVRDIEDSFIVPQELMSWAAHHIPSQSVTVFLGGSVPERRLSPLQVVDLAKGLLRRGYCPVFIGGKDVLPLSRRVMNDLDPAKVQNFVGKTSLQESVALIKTSRMFIGTDSGLMHLASASGARLIALFGAGNMKKWMSQKTGQFGVNEHVPCSPCTSFGYGIPVCRGSFHCLRKMDFENILDRYLPLGVSNG